MNAINKELNGKQPVEYHNITLVRPIGKFAVNTQFAVAVVDWLNGQVQLFQREEDWNKTPTYSDIHREQVPTLNNALYVTWLYEFLQRGHSLLEPMCRCTHGFTDQRARQLGITMPLASMPEGRGPSLRNGQCKLPRTRVGRTLLELSQEIAVGDISRVRDASGETVLETLRRSAKVAEAADAQGQPIFHFRATLGGITSKEELLRYINEECPMGLKEPGEKDTYNGVKEDIDALVREELVYCVENVDKKPVRGQLPRSGDDRPRVLFPRMLDLDLKVDHDIRRLWTDNADKKSGKVPPDYLEQELRKAGIAPTAQVPPEQVRESKKRRAAAAAARKTSHRSTTSASSDEGAALG
eukprot:CAMPEP_0113687080 /NCGR_PEP_ID=MMETSP0038_2-20120614/15698_1 /TAXON_ID=2898 /ORGANISM="Cryptomonas paramecium" /LENGTH=354 /DNA_ID=CAMNT_0000607577 /DNA_START=187 /DNA_END=1248 /DNA_ORIENTATION=- /assembly_acc=CAM_ASM_000170